MANMYRSDSDIATEPTEGKSSRNSGGRKMLTAAYFLIVIAAFALALLLMRPGPLTRSPDRDTRSSDSPRGGGNAASVVRSLPAAAGGAA